MIKKYKNMIKKMTNNDRKSQLRDQMFSCNSQCYHIIFYMGIFVFKNDHCFCLKPSDMDRRHIYILNSGLFTSLNFPQL